MNILLPVEVKLHINILVFISIMKVVIKFYEYCFCLNLHKKKTDFKTKLHLGMVDRRSCEL